MHENAIFESAAWCRQTTRQNSTVHIPVHNVCVQWMPKIMKEEHFNSLWKYQIETNEHKCETI